MTSKQDSKISKSQKELLLKLLEHDQYREFGKQFTPRTTIDKSRADIERFWSKAASVLNTKGPAKTAGEWKRSWHDCCRYAIKQAKLHGKPDEDCSPDEFGTVKYSTGFPSVDRTMKIIGWEVAFSGGPSDEDKENPWEDETYGISNDTLTGDRARSPLSVLSASSRISSNQPPPKKRSLSPFSRSSSPSLGRPMSPFTVFTQSSSATSTAAASCTAGAGCTASAGLTELAVAVNNIAEVIQKNTTVLEELKVLFTNNNNTFYIPQTQGSGSDNVEELPVVELPIIEVVQQPGIETDYNLNMLAAPSDVEISGSDVVFSAPSDLEPLELLIESDVYLQQQ